MTLKHGYELTTFCFLFFEWRWAHSLKTWKWTLAFKYHIGLIALKHEDEFISFFLIEIGL